MDRAYLNGNPHLFGSTNANSQRGQKQSFLLCSSFLVFSFLLCAIVCKNLCGRIFPCKVKGTFVASRNSPIKTDLCLSFCHLLLLLSRSLSLPISLSPSFCLPSAPLLLFQLVITLKKADHSASYSKMLRSCDAQKCRLPYKDELSSTDFSEEHCLCVCLHNHKKVMFSQLRHFLNYVKQVCMCVRRGEHLFLWKLGHGSCQ